MPTTQEKTVTFQEGLALSLGRRGVGVLNISWLPGLTLLLTDLLAWPALFCTVGELRTMIYGTPGEMVWPMLVIPNLLAALTLHTLGGYDRRTAMIRLAYSVEHLLGLSLAFFLSGTAIYGLFTFGPAIQPSRLTYIISFGLYIGYTLSSRRWVARALATHESHRHFIIVGPNATVEHFESIYQKRGMHQELHHVTSFDEAWPFLNENTDGLILAMSHSKIDPTLAHFLAYVHFRHIPVFTLESFYESVWRQVPVESIDGWWAFAQDSLLARDSIYDHVKRIFDLISAAFALVILSPLLLLIGLAIRIETSGPAIFRQTRVGRDGKPFTLFKFRSMREGSEKGAIYTAEKDPRITRIGGFLRKTRLDELPQLWNVLLGDMSIIGPRAEWAKLAEGYEANIPFYGYRHLVRPGITGWAQVNYKYGASDDDAVIKLKYDLYYIRHYSMALDFAIILKTLHLIIFAKGR